MHRHFPSSSYAYAGRSLVALAALLLLSGDLLAQTTNMTVVSHPFAGDGPLARLGAVVGEMVTVQWAGRGERRVLPSASVCANVACGAQSARSAGAHGALIGNVHQLGERLALTAYWVRADGVVVATAMTTAKDEAELPDAARRLAADLETPTSNPPPSSAPSAPPAPPAPPTPIPSLAPAPLAPAPPPTPPAYAPAPEARAPEAYAPPRLPDPPMRDLSLTTRQSSFPVLRLGYFHPLSTSFPKANSLSGELSLAFVQGSFLIEPRIAFRRSFETEDEWYAEVPADLGLFVRFGQADVYPILGGGVGLHYMTIRRVEAHTVGSVIYTRHRSEVDDTALAFGGFGRAGLGFHLSDRSEMFITGDIDVTGGEIFGRSPHCAAVLNIGFGFGGWAP